MKKVDRTGENHTTNQGYTIEIIECFNNKNCTIRFDDENIIKNVRYNNIIRGKVKNPYHPSVYGVGYLGVGNYSGKPYFKIHDTWLGMFQRCYSEKYQKRQPTYKECFVSEEWHNFQVFASWFEENYRKNQQLDKDILIKGNKIYSPETCCFVPQEINLLLVSSNSKRGKYPIGVHKLGNRVQAQLTINGKQVYLGLFDSPEEAFQAYKVAKEKHIKEMAEKYRPQLAPQTYQALINYKVEITD